MEKVKIMPCTFLVSSLLFISLTLTMTKASAESQLLAYWSFDTAIGNAFVDYSDHGHNALWTGTGIGITSGIKGNALSCSGGWYEIVVSNSKNDFVVPTFTIESWLYSNIPFSQMINGSKILDFQAVNSGIRNGYSTHIDNQGKMVLSMSSSDGSAWETATSSTSIQSNTWYHIACTFDGSYLKVYINGVLNASTMYQGTYVPPQVDARIACQRLTDGTVRYFVNGKLDELKLYNYALPVDSIVAHYNEVPHASAPLLIPYAPDPTWNRKPTLTWHPVRGADNYSIQINVVPNFAQAYITEVVVDTFYSPFIELPTGYIYWHVRSNLFSNYSVTDTFLVLNDSVPRLIPMSPDTQENRRPRFAWHQATGATLYRLQIDTIGNFSYPFISLPLADSVFTPAIDLPKGKIVWRIGALSDVTRYSPTDTFWIAIPTIIEGRPDLNTSMPSSMSLVSKRGNISVTYWVEKPGIVSLSIYSLAGEKIATLFNGYSSSGRNRHIWDGRDYQGGLVPNGCYMAVLTLNGQRLVESVRFLR